MNGAKEALIYSVQLLSSPGIMSRLAELAREMNLINQERILKYADPQRHRSTPKVNWSITHATNWPKIFCVFQKSNSFSLIYQSQSDGNSGSATFQQETKTDSPEYFSLSG
jgi:hypothetical protein